MVISALPPRPSRPAIYGVPVASNGCNQTALSAVPRAGPHCLHASTTATPRPSHASATTALFAPPSPPPPPPPPGQLPAPPSVTNCWKGLQHAQRRSLPASSKLSQELTRESLADAKAGFLLAEAKRRRLPGAPVTPVPSLPRWRGPNSGVSGYPRVSRSPDGQLTLESSLPESRGDSSRRQLVPSTPKASIGSCRARDGDSLGIAIAEETALALVAEQNSAAIIEELQGKNVTLMNENAELRVRLQADEARTNNFMRNVKDSHEQLRNEMTQLRLHRETEDADIELRMADVCRERDELLAEVATMRKVDVERSQQLESLRLAFNDAQHAAPVHSAESSESRLRTAMTTSTSSTKDLQNAIEGVEALISEAKRELATKQFRDKRAAHEALYSAISKSDEAELAVALSQAREAGVDEDDLLKGEETLSRVQSMSVEEQQKAALKELSKKKKEQAYLFAKRDNVGELRALLEGLEEEILWQDWKDHAGRSLWRYSQELKAVEVEAYLAPLVGKQPLLMPRRMIQEPLQEPSPLVSPRKTLREHCEDEAAQAMESLTAAIEMNATNCEPTKEITVVAIEIKAMDCETTMDPDCSYDDMDLASSYAANTPITPCRSVGSKESSSQPSSSIAPVDPHVDALKMKAFRAVVQDDTSSLDEVLVALPVAAWSDWQNKAGKTLLALSEERGSSLACAALMRALGMVYFETSAGGRYVAATTLAKQKLQLPERVVTDTISWLQLARARSPASSRVASKQSNKQSSETEATDLMSPTVQLVVPPPVGGPPLPSGCKPSQQRPKSGFDIRERRMESKEFCGVDNTAAGS